MPTVEKVLRWIVIGGIFILPTVALILTDNLFFPYITGKNFTFRIVVEIITGAWFALAVCLPKYRPKRGWILAAFALFVIIIAIADAQGVNPLKSFWSNYERMDGWITVVHTFLFLVVAACVLDTENLWKRFFQWSVIVSFIVSLMGLLQVVGILDLGSGGTGLEGRVDTTFGNPIYLAAYMLFSIFFAALLWYQMWRARSTGQRLWPSVWYGCVIALDTLVLLFTATRGATFGLIGGALLALVIYALSKEASARLKKWTTIAVACVVVISLGLYVGRSTPLVQSVGILDRIATTSFTSGDTIARLYNIEIAWQGIKERPILGWGQENYAIVFDKYYDPRMYAQEQWFDRVHNIVFDWWIAGGTLGLLSYISIFVATLWALWRKGTFAVAERSILTGLLAGYVVHNLTVFDNVTSYILFATMLGYIVYRDGMARKAGPIMQGEWLPKSALPVAGIIGLLVAFGAAWWANAAALEENQTLIAAISPQTGGAAQNLALFKEAIAYNTYGNQEAREQLSQIALQILQTSSVPADLKTSFVQTSVQELDLQAKQSPLDARFPLFAGTVLSGAGEYAQASVELQRALSLSPKKQSILYEIASNQEASGDTTDMVTTLAQAFNLDTDDLDARLYYASALIETNQESEAQQILAPVVASGEAADPRIASAYAAKGDYSALVPIWVAHVKADPTDAQGYFTLAAIYYQMHDNTEAIAVLTTVGTAIPSTQQQANQYIQEIQSGTLSTQ